MPNRAKGRNVWRIRSLMLVIALSAVVMALGVRAIHERNERTRARLAYLAAKARAEAADEKAWRELYAHSLELLSGRQSLPIELPPLPPGTTRGADPWFENRGSQPDLRGPFLFRRLENWEPNAVRYGDR